MSITLRIIYSLLVPQRQSWASGVREGSVHGPKTSLASTSCGVGGSARERCVLPILWNPPASFLGPTMPVRAGHKLICHHTQPKQLSPEIHDEATKNGVEKWLSG